MASSESGRRVDPPDTGKGLARIAVTVRQHAAEIERVAGTQPVHVAAQLQLQHAFNEIAGFFSRVADLLVTAGVRLDDMDIALQQLALRAHDDPFELDRAARTGRREADDRPVARALHR